MGKEGDLWDDSALIKAFDHAVSKYKTTHGLSGSTAAEKAVAKTDNGTSESHSNAEHVQNDDKNASLETAAEIGDTSKLLEIKENSPSEADSSANCIGSSSILNGNLPPTNENSDVQSDPQGKHNMVSSDVQSQNEAMWYPNNDAGYNQLLNKYYEIEGQRQQILQQLNQYSNWNYQDPFSGASTSGDYQASVPQPYETVTCSCPYGCRNWVVPCSSFPASCTSGACTDENCSAVPRGTPNENSMSPEDPGFVKTAMVAAERALSSLRKEANRGEDKQLGMETGHFADSTMSATDLDVVLKAWYSAGFYTGKYLSEQSMEKRKHGQGH